MTLILTFVHRQGIIQVVDRLVTLGTSPWDCQSNKTVLFAARDGFVTVAYTGLAYIEGIPTDQWVAETLRGARVELLPDGRPATISMGKASDWPDIGQTIERLAKGLEPPPAACRLLHITVVMAGWQFYRRKRPRVFGLTIKKHSASSKAIVQRLPRHFERRSGFWLMTEPDGHLSKTEQITLAQAMSVAGNAEIVKQAMVTAVRSVAARSHLVGPNCMCVMISSPAAGYAEVAYDSRTRNTGRVLRNDGRTFDFPISFSPWIVTERLTMAPAINSGGGTRTNIGPWQLRIEGTSEVSRPILGLQSTQDRRPQPK